MTTTPTKTVADAPVNEIGYQVANPHYWWLYESETTPELVWPQSIYVYDSMRKTDSQVASVLRAVTLPIRRTQWRIDPNGARPEVVEFVADDLGLPIVGQNPKAPPRLKDRFSWHDHLREALLMLPHGHAYFEQEYRVTEDASRAHLRKLALRPAKSIQKINVARDGGLVSIEQYWAPSDGEPQPIPVNRLVAYIYEREGGNWLGTSILRAAYKNSLLKDRLLRVWAQTIERNGMGIPLYKGQDGAPDLSTGLAMAKAWRAGDAAGTAIPFGADLVLRGVEGTLPDAEPAVRYHDEQLARAVLAHFLNLDTQSHGSYALGASMGDFFVMSLQTLGQQVADIGTCHIIEDIVDVNWGPDEPAPRLVFDEIGSRQAATAQAIQSLVDAGVLRPDEVLEESTRQQYGLPPADPSSMRTPPAPGGGQQPIPTDGSPTPGDVAAPPVAASAGDGDPKGDAPSGAEQVAAKYNPRQPRIPGGHEGGGRWGAIGGAIHDALKALTGQEALDAVPTEYRSGPEAHYGNYEGAQFTGPTGGGNPHALAEYEGVEYQVTNQYLRNDQQDRDYSDLSDQEVYPGAGYSNRSLVREHDAETAARIAEIDKVMGASRLQSGVEVDRVIKDGKSVFGQAWREGVMNAATKDFDEQDREYERWLAGDRPDLTGMSWQEKAYVSTSADTEHSPLFGERWARMQREHHDSQGEPVIMTIRVPEGTGAVQLGQMGWSTGPGGKKMKNSAEILLEHGLTMTVVADHGVDDQGFRRLDVVASRGD